MNKLPDPNNILCKEVFDKMKEKLKFLADKFKINNINDDFFKEIVIPLSVHFDSLKKDNSPFLVGLTSNSLKVPLKLDPAFTGDINLTLSTP